VAEIKINEERAIMRKKIVPISLIF